MSDDGVNLAEVQDFLHNTPLHIAAKKNYVTLAQFLVNSYPRMLLTPNGQGELPVETAIRSSQDHVAEVLIRRMDHRRLVHREPTHCNHRSWLQQHSTEESTLVSNATKIN